MLSNVPHRVLLPLWIFEQAKGDENEIRRLAIQYMTRYQNYRLLKISGNFAVCEREENFI
ncbi:hypothetical protein ABE60_18320 [Lysinibacillus sphaericus]|nr:hypothetical protein [Lysinibacillus sphaericus]MBG9479445.1 hypothetical protein [Lysinibacillus sphaericus]